MAVIDNANEAHVLMKLLCQKLGLETRTTHIKFVEAFSKLQTDARKYEAELRDMFREGIAKEVKEFPKSEPDWTKESQS